MQAITRELRGHFGQRLNNNNYHFASCRLRGTTWLAGENEQGKNWVHSWIFWLVGWVQLCQFFAAESFETHYGEGGQDGDGDVFKEANIKEFTKHVLENTDGLGVHFMMADGGFSVEGQENIQEILSKQLYLCQCLVAMSIGNSKLSRPERDYFLFRWLIGVKLCLIIW